MGELSVEGLPLAKAGPNACAFHVRHWAAWAPGRETEAAWRQWADPAHQSPSSAGPQTALPAILRRRVSILGQAALRAAWGLPDVGTARIVASSRHGEYGRTLSILESLAGGEPVSPADFTLSVHHALVGLLSIAARNRHGHTTVAAGSDSFAFGLMEAVAAVNETPDRPVILLYYDEGLPTPYEGFSLSDDPPLAVALTLAAADAGDAITLEMSADADPTAAASCQALAFLRFLLRGDRDSSLRGERLTWRWRRYASAA